MLEILTLATLVLSTAVVIQISDELKFLEHTKSTGV